MTEKERFNLYCKWTLDMEGEIDPAQTERYNIIKEQCKDKKVLGLGCGFIEPLLCYNREDCVAVDISDLAILELLKRGFKGGVRVDDAITYNYEPIFDIVVISELLEHLPKDIDCINLVTKALVIAPMVLISVPEGDYPDATHRRAFTYRSLLLDLILKVRCKAIRIPTNNLLMTGNKLLIYLLTRWIK